VTGLDRSSPIPGYYPSAWPCECGGPRRQKAAAGPGLNLQPNETLKSTTRHLEGRWPVMFVQRDVGELYLQGGARPFQADESFGWLEKVDPISLDPVAKSPMLPSGGHNWCGAVVVHENGDLYLTNGRYCHRLSPDCEVVAERELPKDCGYNGLLILSDGNLIMKDIQLSEPSHFSVLEPDKLEEVDRFEFPENSVGRISIDRTPDGEFVYATSDTKVYRLRYTNGALSLDESWTGDYNVPGDDQSFAWDTCIGDDSVWFMDMGGAVGAYAILTPRPVGTQPPAVHETATGPQHVFRMSTADANDRDTLTPFGLSDAGIIAPPLFEQESRVLVAYDSNNGKLGGWRYGSLGDLQPLWTKDIRNFQQPMLFAETNELIVDDVQEDGDYVVVLDLESGEEKGRVHSGAAQSSGMFFCPGWDRDLYYATLFGEVARIYVA
jgi:outer membrane protein assembly factor BamB